MNDNTGNHPERPALLTIVSITLLLYGLQIAHVIFSLYGSLRGAYSIQSIISSIFSDGLSFVVFVLIVLLAGLSTASGIACLKGRAWARKTYIIYMAIALLVVIIKPRLLMMLYKSGSIAGLVLRSAVNVLILVYLFTKKADRFLNRQYVSAAPWTCRKCGIKNPGQTKFCGKCGTQRPVEDRVYKAAGIDSSGSSGGHPEDITWICGKCNAKNVVSGEG